MAHYVLFHGLGTSARSFKPLADLLSGQGHTVTAYDFCGFGTRAGQPYEEKNPIEYAVTEVKDKLEDQNNLRLIAHSMGAAVALKLAEKIPQQIEQVIVIEGNLIAEDCGMLSRKLAAENNEAHLQQTLDTIVEELEKSPYPGWRLWTEDARLASLQTLKNYARALVEISDTKELLTLYKNLPCEKLYLYGDEYKTHPVLQVLGDIPKDYIKGAGHFVMTDKPQESFKAISSLSSRTDVRDLNRVTK